MSEKYFVSIDANFSCESIEEVNLLIHKIRHSEIAKNSIAYNITTNIVKEPSCSKCNPFIDESCEPTIKGHIN
jgi:hypothetical protein